MSLGQTMLSIATLVALTIMVVTSQRYLIEGQKEAVATECFDLATAQVEALMAEIQRKDFDANVTYYYYQSPSEFTAPGSLGPNSTELAMINPWPDISQYKSVSAYSDVDDYLGYERDVSTDLISGIHLSVDVYYVSESDPSKEVNYQTYLKKIDVTAWQDTYLPPVTFSTVVAY